VMSSGAASWLGQIEDPWAPLFAEIAVRFSPAILIATDKLDAEVDKTAARMSEIYPGARLHLQRRATAPKLIVDLMLLLRRCMRAASADELMAAAGGARQPPDRLEHPGS
jgi:hypothetical protein